MFPTILFPILICLTVIAAQKHVLAASFKCKLLIQIPFLDGIPYLLRANGGKRWLLLMVETSQNAGGICGFTTH